MQDIESKYNSIYDVISRFEKGQNFDVFIEYLIERLITEIKSDEYEESNYKTIVKNSGYLLVTYKFFMKVISEFLDDKEFFEQYGKDFNSNKKELVFLLYSYMQKMKNIVLLNPDSIYLTKYIKDKETKVPVPNDYYSSFIVENIAKDKYIMRAIPLQIDVIIRMYPSFKKKINWIKDSVEENGAKVKIFGNAYVKNFIRKEVEELHSV